jgi:Branched-chain amino acid transport protein (AzlD)
MSDFFTIAGLQSTFGPFWAFAVLLIFAFLPTEFWRVLGVMLGKGLNEQSEGFRLVRMISVGLVTAVVGKLVLQPSGSLANLSALARFGAFFAAVVAFYLFRRSLAAGLGTGVGLVVLFSMMER